jgi:hypothetical protein
VRARQTGWLPREIAQWNVRVHPLGSRAVMDTWPKVRLTYPISYRGSPTTGRPRRGPAQRLRDQGRQAPRRVQLARPPRHRRAIPRHQLAARDHATPLNSVGRSWRYLEWVRADRRPHSGSGCRCRQGSPNEDPPILAGAVGPTQWTQADRHGHGSSGTALDCASPAALATFCSDWLTPCRSGVTLGTDRPRQRRRMRNM